MWVLKITIIPVGKVALGMIKNNETVRKSNEIFA